MDAQSPPEAKTPLADWVIENAGSLESLYARVDEIAKVMRHAALGS
jgi:dephospho-CoA kinase